MDLFTPSFTFTAKVCERKRQGRIASAQESGSERNIKRERERGEKTGERPA